MSLALTAEPRSISTPAWEANSVERARDARYPLSRWYARPLALAIASYGARHGWRPAWFTWANLALALLAAGLLTPATPTACWLAAAGVWLAWLCDRVDGALARAARCESAWGAWLDGNIDEATDLIWQAAVAWTAMALGYAWAGYAFAAFVSGKYLFLHSLQAPEGAVNSTTPNGAITPPRLSLLANLYHLPANADVRLHLLLAALIAAAWLPVCLPIELVLCAAYYHFRWLARFALVYRRLSPRTQEELEANRGLTPAG